MWDILVWEVSDIMGRILSELVPDERPPAHVSSVVTSVLDTSASPQLAKRRQAWLAWQRANGDRERAHTVFVSTREPRRGATDPIVVVGVDSHAFLSDLSANKEIYLARLRNVGFAASALEVRIAQRKVNTSTGKAQTPLAQSSVTPTDLELTPEERAYVADMVARLPESIKPSASKALEKSILRKKRV